MSFVRSQAPKTVAPVALIDVYTSRLARLSSSAQRAADDTAPSKPRTELGRLTEQQLARPQPVVGRAVSLSSPSKANFKGLIVQAVNEKGEPTGKFLAGKGLKTLDSCSAVTHSDSEPKKTATLVWEAPAEMKAKAAVSFRATVVAKFDEFYMNIKSNLAPAS